jgi:prepilin-type N-terminal cleavage/methylation domain-containing protein
MKLIAKITRRLARQRGFTLIELLVAVGILGLLAAAAIPAVAKFTGRGQAEARKTERASVQTATDVYMSEYRLVDIVGNTAGDAPVTDFDSATFVGLDPGAASLAGPDGLTGTVDDITVTISPKGLYPNFLRSTKAMNGVGYCWESNGRVTQKVETVISITNGVETTTLASC